MLQENHLFAPVRPKENPLFAPVRPKENHLFAPVRPKENHPPAPGRPILMHNDDDLRRQARLARREALETMFKADRKASNDQGEFLLGKMLLLGVLLLGVLSSVPGGPVLFQVLDNNDNENQPENGGKDPKPTSDRVAKSVLEHKSATPTDEMDAVFLEDWKIAATSFGNDNKELEAVDAVMMAFVSGGKTPPKNRVKPPGDSILQNVAHSMLVLYNKSTQTKEEIAEALKRVAVLYPLVSVSPPSNFEAAVIQVVVAVLEQEHDLEIDPNWRLSGGLLWLVSSSQEGSTAILEAGGPKLLMKLLKLAWEAEEDNKAHFLSLVDRIMQEQRPLELGEAALGKSPF